MSVLRYELSKQKKKKTYILNKDNVRNLPRPAKIAAWLVFIVATFLAVAPFLTNAVPLVGEGVYYASALSFILLGHIEMAEKAKNVKNCELSMYANSVLVTAYWNFFNELPLALFLGFVLVAFLISTVIVSLSDEG